MKNSNKKYARGNSIGYDIQFYFSLMVYFKPNIFVNGVY